jgi:carbonic anhydrase
MKELEIADCCLAGTRHGPRTARFSRRRLLGTTLAGAVASVLAGAELAGPSVALAKTINSPDEALKTLLDGNQRFVERKLTFYQEDLGILQQNTAEKQEPFASVLSCADSRVPVELIFDQSIGHVFVNRVAGNIATTEIMASIEYGAAVLGTKVIMVLGSCREVGGNWAALAPGWHGGVDQAARSRSVGERSRLGQPSTRRMVI